MKKCLASAILAMSMGSCAHPMSRIPHLPNDAMALKNYMSRLDTPQKLSAFNPLIEEIGGKMPLDASKVYIVDRQRLRWRCGKYANGCYWPVPLLRRIYLDRRLDKPRRSGSFMDYRNPRLVEGSNILTTYVHEQGHHMDKSLSVWLGHRAFDELEAMLFTLVFLQEFTKKNMNMATTYFYDELGNMIIGASTAIRGAGRFRTYGELVNGYRNYLIGLKEDKEFYEYVAPHTIGRVGFVILIKEFGFDVARMYRFIHNSSDSVIEERINKALSSFSRRRASLLQEIEVIRKHASPLMDAHSGCTDPKIPSFSCSLINPSEKEVLSDPSKYQIASLGEDSWKLAQRLDGEKDITKKAQLLYQSANKIDQLTKRTPWTFWRFGNNTYGRNKDLFAILRESYMVEIFRRKRDCQGMDLTLKWGRTVMATEYVQGKKTGEKLLTTPELILLRQNIPTRNYGQRPSAQLHMVFRRENHRYPPAQVSIKWKILSSVEENLHYPSSASFSGIKSDSSAKHCRLKAIAEYVAAKLKAGTAGK